MGLWGEAVGAVIDICYSQQLGVLVVYSCLVNLHACSAHCIITVGLIDLAIADHEVGCTCMLSPNFMFVQHAPSLLCPDYCTDYVHLQYVWLVCSSAHLQASLWCLSAAIGTHARRQTNLWMHMLPCCAT